MKIINLILPEKSGFLHDFYGQPLIVEWRASYHFHIDKANYDEVFSILKQMATDPKYPQTDLRDIFYKENVVPVRLFYFHDLSRSDDDKVQQFIYKINRNQGVDIEELPC